MAFQYRAKQQVDAYRHTQLVLRGVIFLAALLSWGLTGNFSAGVVVAIGGFVAQSALPLAFEKYRPLACPECGRQLMINNLWNEKSVTLTCRCCGFKHDTHTIIYDPYGSSDWK